MEGTPPGRGGLPVAAAPPGLGAAAVSSRAHARSGMPVTKPVVASCALTPSGWRPSGWRSITKEPMRTLHPEADGSPGWVGFGSSRWEGDCPPGRALPQVLRPPRRAPRTVNFLIPRPPTTIDPDRRIIPQPKAEPDTKPTAEPYATSQPDWNPMTTPMAGKDCTGAHAFAQDCAARKCKRSIVPARHAVAWAVLAMGLQAPLSAQPAAPAPRDAEPATEIGRAHV